MNYELRANIFMSCVYCTSYELRVILIARVTSYSLYMNYCLLHKLRMNFYKRLTSYCLLHELRVTVYCLSYELNFYMLFFNYELQ